MSQLHTASIRVELARGHLSLGELDEAYVCLTRALRDHDDAPGMEAVLRDLLEACRAEKSPLFEAVRELCDSRAAEPAQVPAPVVYDIPRAEPRGREARERAPTSAPNGRDAGSAPRGRSADAARLAHCARLESWLARVRERFAVEGAPNVW